MEHDVNSDEGFSAALAEAAGVDPAQVTPETETPSVLRGLEESAPREPGRDDEGKFTPAAPEAGAEEETEAPDETVEPEGEEEAPAPEPGSVEEQLKNAQEVIGRQGNELGERRKAEEELRKELARLEGRLDQVGQQPEYAPDLPGMTEEDTDALAGMFAEQGVNNTLAWIATNREELFETALEMAGDYSVADTIRWATAYYGAAGQPAQIQEQAPQEQPWETNQRLQWHMTGVLNDLKEVAGTEYEVIKDQIVPALTDAPDIIKNAVLSEDADLRAQGVRALHEISRGRAITAATDAASSGKEEQLAAAKHATALATGSQRAVPKRQPGAVPTEEDVVEARKRFHEQILKAPTTSVADGLREGLTR